MKTLTDKALEIFTPKGAQTVSEWASENIVIPSSISNFGGRYQNINKYTEEPLNRAGEIGCERLVLCYGTQCSKTISQALILLHSVATNPRPSMVVFPSADLGRRYSIDRLQKIIEASPSLHEYLPESGDDYTNMNMRLKPCTISIVGAGVPSSLSSASIGCLIVDEVDQLPDSHTNTNGSLSLCLQRTKMYGHNATTVLASTPTCASESGETIWDQFLLTDQRYYEIPCLECGALNKVHFSDTSKFHVVFDTSKDEQGIIDVKTAMDTARLKCPACGSTFNDSQKHSMINDDRAKWVSNNPNGYKGWYGYNAHTLLNSMVTMAEGVRLFLASKESTNQLQSFINNYCAEPYIHTVDDAPNPIDLDNIQSEYEQGAIIKDALYFVACDVQMLYIPAVVIAQTPDGTQHLVDWQECGGFNDVAELQRKYNAEQVIIDAGYNSKVVYKECHDRGWIPCRGFAQMQVFYDFVNLDIEQGKASKYSRKRVYQMNINKEHYAREFFRHRSGFTGAFYIYKNAPYELKRQLCSEVEVSRTNKQTGREQFSFRQIYKNNHALDAVVYAQAFIDYFKGHNITKQKAAGKRKPINERIQSEGDELTF